MQALSEPVILYIELFISPAFEAIALGPGDPSFAAGLTASATSAAAHPQPAPSGSDGRVGAFIKDAPATPAEAARHGLT